MNRVVRKRTEGFTIIELMLAMAFVAVLLFAIALSILQIAMIYNKGMTLKEVNQTGRSISNELSRNIAASDAFVLTSSLVQTSAGGRLCLGQYSYLWNYAEALESGASNLIRYASSPNEEIHLLKVPDTASAYCAAGAPTTVSAADKAKSAELLKSGDRMLSMHQFAMSTNAAGTDSLTGQQLYQLSFTIGTGDVSALTSDRTQCLPPGNANANFAYCAVQQFSLVIRAGNKVN